MNELRGACIIGQSGGPTSVINASAYGVIGCYIGLRFARASLAYVGRHLPAMLVSALALIASCALFAWALAAMRPKPKLIAKANRRMTVPHKAKPVRRRLATVLSNETLVIWGIEPRSSAVLS